MLLVGFIIRIYHNAQSSECQICMVYPTKESVQPKDDPRKGCNMSRLITSEHLSNINIKQIVFDYILPIYCDPI